MKSISDVTAEFIPVRYHALLVEYLRRQGLQANVLAGTGLAETDLADHARLVRLDQIEKLFANIGHYLPLEGLGFAFGETIPLAAHGILGLAAMSAQTYGDALETLSRYFRLLTPLLTLDCILEPEQAVFPIRPTMPLTAATRRLSVEAVISSLNMQSICLLGDSAIDFCARLDFSVDIRAVKLAGAIQLVGDADQCCLELPRRYLGIPLASADEHTAKSARVACEALLRELPYPGTITATVRHIIREHIDQFLSQAEVAERFCVSEKTLYRRLAEEGMSYRTMQLEEKMTFAQRQLKGGQHSVTTVAYMTGYTDPANFARAYQKFYGHRPSVVGRQIAANQRGFGR